MELCLFRERERERERAWHGNGTGILFEEPNPTGSRPSDLIGLYRKWQRTKRPQPGELGIGIQQVKRHARSAVAVVMVASSEQANAWRPGREEAVKAMGLVRGTDQEERPQPAKKSSREEGGGDRAPVAKATHEREREREYVIQEGNRAPVFKATHSRYEERPGSQRTKRRCLSGQIECSYGHIGLSEKVCVKERAPPFGSLCRPLI